MSDPCCVYTSEELEKLDEKARDILRRELKKQIKASREISAIIYADNEAKKILKERLRATYNELRKKR
jgi:ABC-type Fe3+/spermidine/putrescine transport system ATPase subunit